LISAQESPYKLTHGDLKCDNIFITDANELYLIDWGITGFSYNGYRYQGYIDQNYADGKPFINGALDTFHLLKSLRQGVCHMTREAKQWISNSFDSLFGQFRQFGNVMSPGTQLLDIPVISDDIYHGTHKQHMDFMNQLTYRHVAQRLGIEARPVLNYQLLQQDRLAEIEEIGYEKGFGKKKSKKSKKKGGKRKSKTRRSKS
jgi:serine/threonine protein kinase